MCIRDRDVSGGDLDSGKRRYLLRTIGRFETTAEMEDMVIARRDGAFVRLRDLGYVELSTFEVDTYFYSHGIQTISLGVVRQIGSNVVDVKDRVIRKVEELNNGLLPERGLQMEYNFDDVLYITDSVVNVRNNLVIGALLATFVLFLLSLIHI